jgi:hypothetical protein
VGQHLDCGSVSDYGGQPGGFTTTATLGGCHLQSKQAVEHGLWDHSRSPPTDNSSIHPRPPTPSSLASCLKSSHFPIRHPPPLQLLSVFRNLYQWAGHTFLLQGIHTQSCLPVERSVYDSFLLASSHGHPVNISLLMYPLYRNSPLIRSLSHQYMITTAQIPDE